jgi:acyl-CoA reductase-like NAD-dependent aldehyde dehydrogenase
VQRIRVQHRIGKEFTERFVSATAALKVGDPLDEECDVGPMIDESEAVRGEAWIHEAVGESAKILVGGKREGAVLHPTVLTHVTQAMKVVCSEVFAPVVSILPFDDFEEALHQVNDTSYGLQAGVFCRDVQKVWQAIKRLDFGGLIINDVPTFRR